MTIIYYKSHRSLLLVSIALIMLYACSPDEPLPQVISSEQKTILGKKLANPYSVKNMRMAYEKIKSTNPNGRTQELDIQATHLYVRFLPPTYALYDTLTSDSTLYVQDHPIDYEIREAGDYYHDPTINDTLPTYQYTSVPVNYIPPQGIAFEVLEELYLPRQDSTFAGGRINSGMDQFLDELEYEALNITGNLPVAAQPNKQSRTAGWLPSKYTPTGNLRVRDTRLGIIPLVGAKVRTRRWFEVHEAITDANGNFRTSGNYRYNFNYYIIWERADFDIRSGTLGQASFGGPNMKGDWNLTIDGGVQSFYAHVFRGAVRYFYGDIGGLKRPNVWGKLKINAYDKNNDSGTSGINWGNWTGDVRRILPGLGWTLPNIKVWRYGRGREYDSDELFSTAVHEITHSSHIELMNAGEIQYFQVSEIIYESWATAVEWQITCMEYRERGITNYGSPTYSYGNRPIKSAFQYWNKDIPNGMSYTSLFIDLVDDYNQIGQVYYPNPNGIVNDQVNGYTLVGIESTILKHTYGLSSLKSYLKNNKPPGNTDAKIELYMSYF